MNHESEINSAIQDVIASKTAEQRQAAATSGGKFKFFPVQDVPCPVAGGRLLAACDEYDGPQGFGVQPMFWFKQPEGDWWIRIMNFGPEISREMDWQPCPQPMLPQ